MNNSNSDGLKDIYFIQSADYQYAHIDLRDTTLLLGESGVGKTTIMRAVLFFYTMDNSMLDIDTSSKKPFNQWYFQDLNSHIIYKYKRGDSNFLFIISSSGKLHYTFVDITNNNIGVKELFLQEKIPANLEILTQNIQKLSLPNFQTTIKSEYINKFHYRDIDKKKIVHKSKTEDFALFNDIKSREEFAKTLSNIFATSKVTSNNIKKTIVSLIDDSTASIDLIDIKRNFDNYIWEKREIEKFEKKIPQIKKLSHKLEEYNKTKKEFKEKAIEIKLLKDRGLKAIEENKIKMDKLDKEKQELEIDFRVEDKNQKNLIKNQNKIIIRNTQDIESLKKREEGYKSRDIDNLVIEYNKELSYENDTKINRDKLEALTSTQTKLKDKYNSILQKLKQDRDNEILKIKKFKIAEDGKIALEKEILLDNRDNEIQQETQKVSIEKDKLNDILNQENSSFNQIKIEQGKLEYYPFNQENIDRYSKEKEQYRVKLSSIRPEIIENQNKIENIEREIENIEIRFKQNQEQLDDKQNKFKKELFIRKEDIEKKLDFDNNNLYGEINKSSLKNKQKIVTYIKDDILFSTKKFSINEVDDSDTIFGMAINFKEELSNDYNQEVLLRELQEIKIDIQNHNKDFRKEKEKLRKNAKNETDIKNRERSRLYSNKKRAEEEEKKYIEYQLKSKKSLEEEKNRAEELREENNQRLNREYIEQETNIKSLQNQIIKLEQIIQNIENSIKIKTKKESDRLKSESKELIEKENNDIKKIDIDYQDTKEKTEKELLDILSNKGIDTKLLQEYQNKIDNIKIKLKKIEENTHFVVSYLKEYQNKIKNIPKLEEKLFQDNNIFKLLEDKQKEIDFKYKEENNKINNTLKNIKIINEEIKRFIKKYDNEISNQDIGQKIKSITTLEHNKNIDNLLEDKEFMSEVISNIIKLNTEIMLAEKSFEKLLLQCLSGLDKNNIFKIEIIDDYINNSILEQIKVAKDLIEYIEKDKIKIFKDNLSNIFNSSIETIRKSMDIFNNAVSDIYSEVSKLKNRVNYAVKSFQVIDNIYLKTEDSSSEVLQMLNSLIYFYDENSDKFLNGLFRVDDEKNQRAKDKLSSKINDLVQLLDRTKERLYLEDGFLLKFKVIEKGNDLGWRETLNDTGSNGTSTLVKSIINISMLQLVNKDMNKNQNLISHCILDEIGTISTRYFKELKKFVNSSGFHFLNGMPVEDDGVISIYPTIYIGEDCGHYSKMLLATKEIR